MWKALTKCATVAQLNLKKKNPDFYNIDIDFVYTLQYIHKKLFTDAHATIYNSL